MKKHVLLLIAIIALLFVPRLSSAGDVDTVLHNAGKEGRAVMLELGSVGCIPCEQMKAVMKKLSADYKGRLDVLFVDVGRDRQTARRFRVFGIPTQVFIDKNGKEFYRHIGYFPYEEIVPVLKKAGL
jgi:thioredoxin 1